MVRTWFGSLAASGGCAWDGNTTRDADFSNNDGAVGSEDYTCLTANWLATSGLPVLHPVPERSG
ncbi:MAG: hypothetical protein H6831_12375 [Planctomycetes bacterium]|nr:hypothetical protein [Planctomycetota bacterium]